MTIDKVMMIARSREILLMKKNERERGRRAGGRKFTHTSLAVCAVATSPRHRAGIVRAKTLPPGPCLSHTDIFGFGAVHKEGVVRR